MRFRASVKTDAPNRILKQILDLLKSQVTSHQLRKKGSKENCEVRQLSEDKEVIALNRKSATHTKSS